MVAGIEDAAEKISFHPDHPQRHAVAGRRPAVVEPFGEGKDPPARRVHLSDEMSRPIDGQDCLASGAFSPQVEEPNSFARRLPPDT